MRTTVNLTDGTVDEYDDSYGYVDSDRSLGIASFANDVVTANYQPSEWASYTVERDEHA